MTLPAKPILTVSVRDLVEFVLRTGDLGTERDFVARDRALAGTRGHQRVQRGRPEGYQKEVRISYDQEAPELILRIQGRIDGVQVREDTTILEEIKTVSASWDRQPDPLHWAQVKCYGAVYGPEHSLTELTLRLTYLDLETDETCEFTERHHIASLQAFFMETAAVYLEWVREHYRWCQERDKSIATAAFPFARYRPGQRELAVAAYRAIEKGERLFVEAPTGIGKTVSVLFPSVKALGEGKVERIFYLTARTTGQAIAEGTLAALRQARLLVRAVTLTAKEKVCTRNGAPCELESCPLAQGYYDRRKSALQAALQYQALDRELLEQLGHEFQVCPFELSLDISSWADVVICDYNYAFDPRAYLRRHFSAEQNDYVLLIDEAHNLVDRAREMFSAELDIGQLRQVRRVIKDALPSCARALSKLIATLRTLGGTMADSAEPPGLANSDLPLFANSDPRNAAPALSDGLPTDGTWRKDFPEELTPLVEDALRKAEVWLARNEPAEFRADLLELYFCLLGFARTAERYDERYLTLFGPGTPGRIRLFCLDPSFLLGQLWARIKAAVLFSATLTPLDYYRDLLGGTPNDPLLQLRSPFPAQNLAVLVHDRIRTTYKARAGTLREVAAAVGALVQGRRGNYLVFFPSYQYLTSVLEEFQALLPHMPVLVQRPGMSESARADFLAAFDSERTQTLVGFAVLGGVFGEGIDLVGDRLIGVAVVGVGLPQICAERDRIREYFQEKAGTGFEFAYTYPGMNRVLQATGRVIRSENDRGVVLLIDTRFSQPRYRRLFPEWWQARRVNSLEQLSLGLRQFWDIRD